MTSAGPTKDGNIVEGLKNMDKSGLDQLVTDFFVQSGTPFYRVKYVLCFKRLSCCNTCVNTTFGLPAFFCLVLA